MRDMSKRNRFEEIYGIKTRRNSYGKVVLDGEQVFVAKLELPGRSSIEEEHTFPDGEDPEFVVDVMGSAIDSLLRGYVACDWEPKE